MFLLTYKVSFVTKTGCLTHIDIMEGLILRPKNAKKPTKIKKEICELRKNLEAAEIAPSTSSSDSDDIIIDEAASTFLKKIKFFQDRSHSKNPIKAKAHHRLIYGLREIKRDAAYVKVVIIARDIEIFKESELSKMVEQIVEKCKENNVPLIYALKKSKLARIFNKQRSIGAVAILDYSGAENLFKDLISASLSSGDAERFLHQNSLFA